MIMHDEACVKTMKDFRDSLKQKLKAYATLLPEQIRIVNEYVKDSRMMDPSHADALMFLQDWSADLQSDITQSDDELKKILFSLITFYNSLDDCHERRTKQRGCINDFCAHPIRIMRTFCHRFLLCRNSHELDKETEQYGRRSWPNGLKSFKDDVTHFLQKAYDVTTSADESMISGDKFGTKGSSLHAERVISEMSKMEIEASLDA